MNEINFVVNKYFLQQCMLPFILTISTILLIIILTVILVKKEFKERVKK
ncbi:MAG: hypothetical protein IJA94_01860 [Bacilli bacterium]|nr:hypothetical protein [Bacilli bacterium]